ELVQTFADQAVIAIENVRLFDEVQARTRELARSVAELRALGEVSRAVSSTLKLETVLETIVGCAADERQFVAPQTRALLVMFESLLANVKHLCGAKFGMLSLREGDAFRTGASSPGELEMMRSTSEVAVCCSSASASSRVRALSCFFNSISELGPLLTCALAFVPVERTLRPLGLFRPLRDKITSSAQSLVPFRSAQPRIEPINPNRTARRTRASSSPDDPCLA